MKLAFAVPALTLAFTGAVYLVSEIQDRRSAPQCTTGAELPRPALTARDFWGTWTYRPSEAWVVELVLDGEGSYDLFGGDREKESASSLPRLQGGQWRFVGQTIELVATDGTSKIASIENGGGALVIDGHRHSRELRCSLY